MSGRRKEQNGKRKRNYVETEEAVRGIDEQAGRPSGSEGDC